MALVLQAASRDSLAEAKERLDAALDKASASALGKLGDELYGVLRLLTDEPTLRRHLADPSVPAEARRALAKQVLDGKVSRKALDLVGELVSSRWSRPADLVEAVEVLAQRATLGVAEKDGTLDDVEDELFRFGRIVAREPRLNGLLASNTTPLQARVDMLTSLLQDKVKPAALRLLTQTVRTPRGRRLDLAAEELSELAAQRRDRYIAHVTAPTNMTAAQERRLAESLTRLYGRPISLQVELDPDLLGGLIVRVGNEVIDGSVSSRLAAARRTLPS